jgi:hypothetical protein
MNKDPDVEGGLEVRQRNHAWYVLHAGSGKEVAGSLRQKRFAQQARADFLATGADFTAGREEIRGQMELWVPAARLWRARSHQDHVDMVTGEHYSWSTHYGQVIPSRVQAGRISRAMRSHAWG